MERSYDFLKFLPKELSKKILVHVDDSYTLAIIAAVSKIWRRFVLENKVCKQFCLDMYPELSKMVDIEEFINRPKPCAIRTEMVGLPGLVVKEHRVFSILGTFLDLYRSRCFIGDSILVTSTGRLPNEEHSFESEDDVDLNYPTIRFTGSKGQSDPTIPETVVCQFVSHMLIISEIHVIPYQEDFERKESIYSAKSVRLSLGHKRSSHPIATRTYDDRFTWTYISPEFEMAQESGVQKFDLPKQVLCLGGVIKMEIFGRVKKNDLDGPYYVRSIRSIDAYGHSLRPEFGINMLDGTGNFILKCNWPGIYGDDGYDSDIPDPDSSDPE